MSGKQYVLDGFQTEELVATRSLTQGGLEELLRQRGIASVTLGPKASAESLRRDLPNCRVHNIANIADRSVPSRPR